MMRLIKDDRGTRALSAEDSGTGGMACELPSFWLAELAEGRGTGPVSPAVARHELDRRGRVAQESLCVFLDALSSRISGTTRMSGAAA